MSVAPIVNELPFDEAQESGWRKGWTLEAKAERDGYTISVEITDVEPVGPNEGQHFITISVSPEQQGDDGLGAWLNSAQIDTLVNVLTIARDRARNGGILPTTNGEPHHD
ncbi:hypothetical protein BH23GEM2_BH23GEM2_20940 [soil metagenome]